MFTGIVSDVGRVTEAAAGRLTIEHGGTAERLAIGGSVAVNGCCLTVVALSGPLFGFDVVPETRSRTTLGMLAAGDAVNLELPMRLEQGLDGHLVQGHVDASAAIRSVRAAQLGHEIEIELPPRLAALIAEKGSVAVDGVSLTVAAVDDRKATFTVALIPHTMAATVASTYRPGTVVNLEADVVARYVQRVITIVTR